MKTFQSILIGINKTEQGVERYILNIFYPILSTQFNHLNGIDKITTVP
jgi:hypothetical protein